MSHYEWQSLIPNESDDSMGGKSRLNLKGSDKLKSEWKKNVVSKNDLTGIVSGERKSLAASALLLRDASPGMLALIDTISTTATWEL